MLNQPFETAGGTPSKPLLLDIYATAQLLSVAPVTVRKLVRQQKLTRVPGVRKLLIPEASCRQFAATAI